jgi:hypothetical protein
MEEASFVYLVGSTVGALLDGLNPLSSESQGFGESSPVVGGSFPMRAVWGPGLAKVPTILFSNDLFTFEQNAKKVAH